MTRALANDSYYALFLTSLPVLADFGLWEFGLTLAGADRKKHPSFLDQSRVLHPTENFAKLCT